MSVPACDSSHVMYYDYAYCDYCSKVQVTSLYFVSHVCQLVISQPSAVIAKSLEDNC